MRYARQALRGQSFIFSHRYITRPPETTGENHISLSEDEFETRRQAGCFAMHWSSHGFHYGIGTEIDLWLSNGLHVVVNGSRAYLSQAQIRYPSLYPVLIRVDSQHLQKRLESRGREAQNDITSRIQRATELNQQVENACLIIENNGQLIDAGEKFLTLLRQPG